MKNVLIQTGFSAEIRDGVENLQAQGGGVALASAKDAERALTEIKATVPCAVLCAIRLRDAAKELHVLVRDRNGKEQVRRRFLHQLGHSQSRICARHLRGVL